MCGIAGFTHRDRNALPGLIRRATESLCHRGPDECNVFEGDHASLGAVRLKIIDLHGGQQPMATEDQNCFIAFNGEIYNHSELRSELEQLGHKFHSQCDTEVALRAFVEWDVGCFSRFRGMFAAAFWQPQKRRLVLVRDRVGIKPLYYMAHGRDLYFGSELKAIFAFDHLPRQLNPKALGFYLSLNYIPGPMTMVDGIAKLEPGAWLEWKDGRTARGRYWRPVMLPEKLSIEDALENLDSLLKNAMREHLLADVPVGLWASGGLDSSTILHYAAGASTQPLRTFSISFNGRGCDESRFYRPLVAQYGTQHEEFDLHGDLDLEDAVREMVHYSDEPSADAGAVPVWFLSKLTARRVRVALSGEGADEIFGGYDTYRADRYARLARRLPARLRQCALSCAGLLPVSDEKIGFEYKLKRFLAGSLLPADEAHFFWNGTFSTAEQQAIGGPLGTGALIEYVSSLSGVPPGDGVNRRLFVDQNCFLPDDILYKCDRMSMAHALEVRPPFLDHRIVEFAGRLPASYKLHGNTTKFLLRKLMSRKLPAAILNRPKEGLDIPAHAWLRGPLRSLLLDVLSPRAVTQAGLLPSSGVQRLIARHLNRQANVGYHLWGLLILHLWIQHWDIQTQAPPVGEPMDALAAAAG